MPVVRPATARSIRSAWLSTTTTPSVAGARRRSSPTAAGKIHRSTPAANWQTAGSLQAPHELKQLLLADLDKFNAALVEKLATYALRRAMTIDDRARTGQSCRAEPGRRLPAGGDHRSARTLRPVSKSLTPRHSPPPNMRLTYEFHPGPEVAVGPPAFSQRFGGGCGAAAIGLHAAFAGCYRGHWRQAQAECVRVYSARSERADVADHHRGSRLSA